MSLKTIIETAENGFLITHINDFVVDGIIEHEESKYVIEDEDDRGGIRKLLTYIGEHFGEPFDRFGKENIRISFDRIGHKAEGYNGEDEI